MTPSDLPNIFFVELEGLWVDTKIPNFQVPRPNVFFSTRAFRRIIILGGKFKLLKNEVLNLKSQCTHDCQAYFFMDVNLQWKDLWKVVKCWWSVEGTTYRGAANHYSVLK